VKNATLRQLKTFEIVARRLSFSRAAEELNLSQPAVSTHIRLLEEHAGVSLFEQLGKKIFLTLAGQEMLRCSSAIIEQFREAEDAMERMKGIAGGRLNVGVISAGGYFFPRLLAEFTQRNPGIQLELTVENRDELLRQLSENRIDLAVIVVAPDEPMIVTAAFAPHPFVIVASPLHPLAAKQRIPTSALARERFIVRERGSDTWHSMDEVFAGDLGRLHAPMEIKNTETIKQAVIAGMGISFLSAHAISLEVQAGLLTVLDVVDFPILRQWGVAHHVDKRLAPVALAFKHFLIEEGAAHIARLTGVSGAGRLDAIV
jgi:DNA-binding transcriptional LysR family regulator